jgi:hypothetical protein
MTKMTIPETDAMKIAEEARLLLQAAGRLTDKFVRSGATVSAVPELADAWRRNDSAQTGSPSCEPDMNRLLSRWSSNQPNALNRSLQAGRNFDALGIEMNVSPFQTLDLCAT